MFLGSSRIQLASSLLIVSSEPSVAFTATARSSEPSPLKSPTAKFGSRDVSGVAAFSKTLATVSRISVGLGGADGLLAGVGLGVGEANGVINNYRGLSTTQKNQLITFLNSI